MHSVCIHNTTVDESMSYSQRAVVLSLTWDRRRAHLVTIKKTRENENTYARAHTHILTNTHTLALLFAFPPPPLPVDPEALPLVPNGDSAPLAAFPELDAAGGTQLDAAAAAR